MICRRRCPDGQEMSPRAPADCFLHSPLDRNGPSSVCGEEQLQRWLERGVGSYGIRLDKSQITRLEARTSNGNEILMIVQYTNERDECGVVRDIVQARNDKVGLVFECVDPKNRSSVAVGTWPDGFRPTSGPALEAWQIEVNALKFVPLTGRVTSTSRNYAGNDDGSDLVKWAKRRAGKKRLNNQNDPNAR